MSESFTPYTEIVTPPTHEVVSFADMQTHLYLDDDTQETYVLSLIDAATQHVQDSLGIQLVTATRKQIQPTLEQMNLLLVQPATAITGIMKKRAGLPDQTITAGNAFLVRDSVYVKDDAVDLNVDPDIHWELTFTCGYGAASSVPAPLVQAVKLLAAEMFENRQLTVSQAVNRIDAFDRLLAPYRSWV